jgi:hypothetical protein
METHPKGERRHRPAPTGLCIAGQASEGSCRLAVSAEGCAMHAMSHSWDAVHWCRMAI